MKKNVILRETDEFRQYMRIIKFFLVSIIMLLGISEIYADNFTSTKTENDFIIQREIALNAKSVQYENILYIRDFIVKHGATISNKKLLKSLNIPTISIKKVKRIKGSYSGANSFFMEVNKNSIKILVTSQTAAAEAIKLLFSLFSESKGFKCFQGGTYIWSSEEISSKNTGGIHSLMVSELSHLNSEIERMGKGATAELIVVTPTDWMVESKILEEILGNKEIYSQRNGYVTLKQLRSFSLRAEELKVNFVLTFDFSSDNESFRRIIGHSIYSVEGMRYIRTILSELHNRCNIQKMSFKLPSQLENFEMERFVKFVNEVSTIIGIEFVKL